MKGSLSCCTTLRGIGPDLRSNAILNEIHGSAKPSTSRGRNKLTTSATAGSISGNGFGLLDEEPRRCAPKPYMMLQSTGEGNKPMSERVKRSATTFKRKHMQYNTSNPKEVPDNPYPKRSNSASRPQDVSVPREKPVPTPDDAIPEQSMESTIHNPEISVEGDSNKQVNEPPASTTAKEYTRIEPEEIKSLLEQAQDPSLLEEAQDPSLLEQAQEPSLPEPQEEVPKPVQESIQEKTPTETKKKTRKSKTKTIELDIEETEEELTERANEHSISEEVVTPQTNMKEKRHQNSAKVEPRSILRKKGSPRMKLDFSELDTYKTGEFISVDDKPVERVGQEHNAPEEERAPLVDPEDLALGNADAKESATIADIRPVLTENEHPRTIRKLSQEEAKIESENKPITNSEETVTVPSSICKESRNHPQRSCAKNRVKRRIDITLDNDEIICRHETYERDYYTREDKRPALKEDDIDSLLKNSLSGRSREDMEAAFHSVQSIRSPDSSFSEICHTKRRRKKRDSKEVVDKAIVNYLKSVIHPGKCDPQEQKGKKRVMHHLETPSFGNTKEKQEFSFS